MRNVISKAKTSNLIIPVAVILFFFSGCCSTEEFQLQNMDTAKKLVQNYYESGRFDNECKEIFDDAISKIENLPPVNNPVVIFDVDETALSNYENTKAIGFGYVKELWHKGILKADEAAIPQTKIFYDWLIAKKIKIIFLTGRYKELYEATKKNLINRGFAKFDTLIVRNENESKIPASEFKTTKREELVARGYNIIACVGDQWSDLVGGNTGIKIKLPNYLYLID